jgi:hypothetical protein
VNPISKKRLEEDRKKGIEAEVNFCKLLQKYDCFTYRFQKGYNKAAVLERGDEYIILPDVWVIPLNNDDFFCEVKSKYPSRYGSYGLEEYRILSLLRISAVTKRKVLYAVYDTIDQIWYWKNLKTLENMPYKRYRSETYVDGSVKRLPVHYYQKAWFKQIEESGTLVIPED